MNTPEIAPCRETVGYARQIAGPIVHSQRVATTVSTRDTQALAAAVLMLADALEAAAINDASPPYAPHDARPWDSLSPQDHGNEEDAYWATPRNVVRQLIDVPSPVEITAEGAAEAETESAEAGS